MSLIETITILVCLSAVFSYVNHRYIKLPVTIGLMAIALVMSLVLLLLGKLGYGIQAEAESFIRSIDFDETLLHGMLSFLLFAGALHINLDDLLEQKWFIGTLACLGVVVSASIVGALTYLLLGWIGIPIPFIGCLLFGALISPTDPIAVLGILKNAKAPKQLEIKITGESLFNDGVGVAVFLVLLAVAETGTITPGSIALLFVQEALGGAAIGLALGYLTYMMLKSINQHHVEILLTLALVMGGYALADAVHASGPIAVVVSGLLIGNQGRHLAMSETTREYLDTFWELIDELLNAVLFVLIGLEVLALTFKTAYLEAGLIAIPLVLFARFVSVSLPVQAFRLFQEFTERATMILTWGGLRGGISVAMALSLPPSSYRDVLITMTYIVVVFSILVQGLTIERLVRASSRA
ncbi:MAG: sodium:proton antiporter [Nitrospira sp.]|nr:sodium:proton antiporter [Nitrospira sp.]MDH4242481.1 sodium:proton antiporter [Nitrospira sp.]MDH4355322.1 sodium:proton antiporter [Nitrospira sp.]MDH5317444.1 sodium:proton antiporter [Nitrospira sp.]